MNKQEIDKLIMSARKDGKKEMVNVYCLVKAEFLKAEKEHGIEPDDKKCIQIIYKMIEQRKDSMKQYLTGNRKDLADAEAVEIGVLDTLVPKLPSEDEIKKVIEQCVTAYKDVHGSVSMKNTREIIDLVNARFGMEVLNIGKFVAPVIKQYM